MTSCLVVFLVTLIPSTQDGPRTAEGIVTATLQMLGRSQWPDGRWKPPRTPWEGLDYTGVTALAMLVFVNDGQTHQHGKYKDNLAKGVRFLRGNMDESGRVRGEPIDQAVAAWALAELCAASGDAQLKPLVKKVIRALLREQKEDGGLGGSGSFRVFITVLGIRALVKARSVGIDVDGDCVKRAAAFLEAQVDIASGDLVAPDGLLDRRGTMAAIYLGRPQAGTQRSETLDAALERRFTKGGYPPDNPWSAYFLTLALMRCGGDAGETFREKQDEWIAGGMRFRGLTGRLYEALTMQVRIRWDRTLTEGKEKE